MSGLRNHIISTLLSLLFFVPALFAVVNDNGNISGVVLEGDGQPVIQAGVQLLSGRDSSLIDGVVTDLDGRFKIRALPGDYILKISFIGYGTKYLNVHQIASREEVNIGPVQMEPESTVLDGSVVRANADPVTIKSDTVVFNAAAFHVADDATLEELLKKIPGLEIDEDGGVMLHGREVKQLLLNGKRYFGGNVKTGLKNIPAEMIENIAAYDRQSEYSRLTGIDDGEEEPVLDLSVKKSMMDGWRGSLDGGYGTSGRYRGRINANKITKEKQSTLIANVHNMGGKSSPNNVSKISMGTGGRGDTQTRDAGYTYASEDNKARIEAHAQYTGQTKDAASENNSTSIYSSSTSYSAGTASAHNEDNMVKANFNGLLKITPRLNILLAPNVQYKKTDNRNRSLSKNYSADPYTLEDPAAKQSNSTDNNSIVSQDDFRSKLGTQYVFKYGRKNTNNVSIRADISYNFSNSDNLYDNNSYKKATSVLGSTRKQSIRTGNKAFASKLQLSSNTLLARHWRVNFSLAWDFKDVWNDRSVYDLKAVDDQWDISRPRPSNYREGFMPEISSDGEYKYNVATVFAGIVYSKKKFVVNAGVNLRPQWGCLSYVEDGRFKENKSFLFTATPNINIKFNRFKNKKLQFTYRSFTGTPSLYNLLPVVNGTSITTVHLGNPDLKPSLTQRAEFTFNTSNREKHNSFIFNVFYQNVSNVTSNSSSYDPETGVKTVTPKNIDGNWNVYGNVSFNKTFRDQRFSVSTNTAVGYYNTMAYLYNKTLKEDEVNQAVRFMGRQTLKVSFRHDWIELVLNASGDLSSENSRLRPDMNRMPWSVKGGGSIEIFFPWNMRLGADYTCHIQRGLPMDFLNRTVNGLNAELSQRVLKGRGTVKIEAYDILGQEINLAQSFSAESRTTRIFNGVNRYIIAKFIYRFKF